MKPETKKLIREKTKRRTDKGTMVNDPDGCWLHARDIRSIINCETDLLKKQIENLKMRMQSIEDRLNKPEHATTHADTNPYDLQDVFKNR
jgi:hypothetical protein